MSIKDQVIDELPQQLIKFTGESAAWARVDRTIEWVDTDAAGHQHNSAIVRFVEAAEAKLFRVRGLEVYFPIAPRVRQELDFRAKLYFGQEVTTVVRVDRVGVSSMTFSFVVWGRPFGGRGWVLAAEGKFVTVCVPAGSDSSQPWPESIRQGLGAS